jgi:hypothetical protein
MSTKSLMHKRCGTLRKSLFSTRGFAKIHIQRPFFNNKKGIQKIVVLKIQMVSTCLNISNCNYNKFNYILRLILQLHLNMERDMSIDFLICNKINSNICKVYKKME